MTKMQEIGVKGNPFDVIFQTAVEMARAVNRLAIRYNNSDLPIVSMDETCLDNYMTRAWLLTLINTFFDWTRVIAVIFTFIYLIRFIKHNSKR